MSFVIKRDAWHDMIEQLGTPMPKHLPDTFLGQETKEGFQYYRFLSGRDVYFYKVTHIQSREVHYEIFPRHITGKRRDRRELCPWEEPVCDNIETFTNSGAANFRFAEIMREA